MNNDTINQIHDAIEADDLRTVIDLIGSHTELLNVETPFGTWLHIAATANSLSIVRWLLEAGININRNGGIAGGSALNEAAEEGHTEIAIFLLNAGAKLDVTDPQRNPLFAAIQAGAMEIVSALLAHGIDPTIKYNGANMKNMDAHAFALEHGQKEIANFIQQWITDHPA